MPPRAPGVNIADAPPPKKMVEDVKKKVRLELKLGFFRCCFSSLRIDEDAVANDERILANVSCEEARTYIRGVNAHHEKGTRRYRMLMRGCLACFLLGAALFGTLMGVFCEEPRIRCEGRLCEPGEDRAVRLAPAASRSAGQCSRARPEDMKLGGHCFF